MQSTDTVAVTPRQHAIEEKRRIIAAATVYLADYIGELVGPGMPYRDDVGWHVPILCQMDDGSTAIAAIMDYDPRTGFRAIPDRVELSRRILRIREQSGRRDSAARERQRRKAASTSDER